MFKFRGIAIRREGLKFTIANIPEKWHSQLASLGKVRALIEFTVAVIGVIAAIWGFVFSFPFITFLLSLFIFFELGRPDLDFQYKTSFTTPSKTMGQSGSLNWEFDPPITIIPFYYLNGEKEKIPEEDWGLYGSEHVELEIPPGIVEALSEDPSTGATVSLPYYVRKITLKRESDEKFEERTPERETAEDTKDEEDVAGRQINSVHELSEGLHQNEGSIAFRIGRADLITPGTKLDITATDNSKMALVYSTGQELIYSFNTQNRGPCETSIAIEDFDPVSEYMVILTWSEEEVKMHVGPHRDETFESTKSNPK